MNHNRKDKKFIPYKKSLTTKARENRKNPSKAETKVWYEILQDKGFENYKFIRQKPLDNFIVDFYCSELLLAIEIDGDSHSEQIDYDIYLSLIHISEPTRRTPISYAVFCLKKKKNKHKLIPTFF